MGMSQTKAYNLTKQWQLKVNTGRLSIEIHSLNTQG